MLGIVAQWLSWRLRLPSILLLLILGFVAGPVTGFLDPDELFGDLLVPLVSVSVAVILFEGGLSLRFAELRGTGSVVRNLISVGLVVTWLVGAGAAHLLFGLDLALATLLGSILVVTGPTVIGPLLRQVRPTSRISSTLKWEGILIDPIGAMLAVLVFEAILSGGFQEATTTAVVVVLKTVLIGGVIGGLGALAMMMLLKRYWIPDFLDNAATLMIVVSVFTASHLLQSESGLLAATVMGIILANQKMVAIKHIIKFKENLRVLLISSLFILLAARLRVIDLDYIGASGLAFLGVLMLMARPIAVALSSLGSGLTWRERLFLSWIAPRGVVAAAVASIFALRLEEAGDYPQAELLVPLTFLVIIGTIAINGLTASPVARLLSVARPNPQGALIVGAHSWARGIAYALQVAGYDVLLVDSNWENVSAARKSGLQAHFGNILSEYILDDIKLDGIGRMLALTPNDEVNSLAALHFADVFGRMKIYQLPSQSKETVPKHLHGRHLFGSEITYGYLSGRFAEGAVVKTTGLTEQFGYESFQALYGEDAVPLFLIDKDGALEFFTPDESPTPRPGQTLISVVKPAEQSSDDPERN